MIRRYLNVVRGEENDAENMEIEGSLLLTLDQMARLINSGFVKVIGGHRISQIWLYNNGTESSYSARVRAQTPLKGNISPFDTSVLLDPNTTTTYTQTVKHKVTPMQSIEITSDLTKRTYEMIANLNLSYPGVNEVVKDRYILFCEGIDNMKILVTADEYISGAGEGEEDMLRIEFELADAFDADSLNAWKVPPYFLNV